MAHSHDDMLLAALDMLASERAVAAPVPPALDEAPRIDACFVCGQPNPGYTSTDKHPEDAPPVAVCGVSCEERYLGERGLYAAKRPKAGTLTRSESVVVRGGRVALGSGGEYGGGERGGAGRRW